MTIAPNSTYTQTKQEFLNSVLNKIGKQEFSNKTYTNPLKRLRGEFINGPTDIEEIYVDRAADTGYSTHMYKLKSGVYITASPKYVEVFER